MDVSSHATELHDSDMQKSDHFFCFAIRSMPNKNESHPRDTQPRKRQEEQTAPPNRSSLPPLAPPSGELTAVRRHGEVPSQIHLTDNEEETLASEVTERGEEGNRLTKVNSMGKLRGQMTVVSFLDGEAGRPTTLPIGWYCVRSQRRTPDPFSNAAIFSASQKNTEPPPIPILVHRGPDRSRRIRRFHPKRHGVSIQRPSRSRTLSQHPRALFGRRGIETHYLWIFAQIGEEWTLAKEVFRDEWKEFDVL